MLTWEELENHQNGIRTSRDITPTAPPTEPIRSIAEWERNQGVIVAYPYYSNYYGTGFGVPVDLIAMMAEDVHVYIIYANASNLSTIQNEIAAGDVNTDNLSYHLIPSDTYWTRDFSPWFIEYGADKQVGIVNFDYNRNRPDDNNVPVEFGELLDVEVFGMEVEHTGGNYMSDGMFKAASTTLVYDENAESGSYNINGDEVDSRMEDFLGITDYIIADDPMDDYIYHIDCWAKFLDVDKVLVGQVPETDYRYEDYEAAADFFANQTSSYGNNYEVYRVYSPDGQPYTNSLIMNEKVYVPVPASGAASNWNDDAIAAYEAAMPGYEIIAVPNTTAPEWQETDALHCRTHEVPDIGMLKIFHSAIYGLQDALDNYLISAEIVSYADNMLYADSLRIYYSVNGGPWSFALMANESGNTFTANIPGQTPGDEIFYYIHAADESGRSENHPYMGAADPHEFVVDDGTSVVEYSKRKLSLFPNPTKGNLSVAMHYFNESNAVLEISDVNGRILRSIEINKIGNYHLLRFDVSDLAQGTYFIRIVGEKQVETSKFIIR